MQIITGFDSEFAAEEKKPQLLAGEYVKMLQALQHDLEVAENVFARTAKGQFKEIVDHEVKRIRADELKEGASQWFAETSVAIDIIELRSYAPDAIGQKIADTVRDFGEYVLAVVGADKVLLESLNTKIIRSSESIYQFRLKQKWAENV